MARISSPEQIAQMRELVANGTRRTEIADQMGVTHKTVWRHTNDMPHPPRADVPDLKRLKRIVRAAETASLGDGADLADRFGLAHASSFRATVHYARKRLAQAEPRS